MSARRVILAWVIALVLVVLAATSDDDPEGLSVGPQHLEEVLAEEAAKGAR